MTLGRAPWLAVAACLAMLLTGCNLGGGSGPSGPCQKVDAPAPAADGPPLAVMRDLSGGPTEYLLGIPGGKVTKLREADGFVPARLAHDRIFFTVRQGASDLEVRTARLGECSSKVTNGILSDPEPEGRAVVVGTNSTWRMYDPPGHVITELAGPGGSWTPDGRLVVPLPTGGIAVYDLKGGRHDIPLPTGALPAGAYGAHRELVSSPAGLQVIDLDDGKTSPLPHAPSAQRNIAVSPDGTLITFVDGTGAPQVLRISDGSLTALPRPGPASGSYWSRDGQWVGVQSPQGGAVMRIADGKSIDLGALVVISW